MQSGIEIPDYCKTEYEDMKMGKKDYRCIVYTIEDEKTVQIRFTFKKECDQKKQYYTILKEIDEKILNAKDTAGNNKGTACYVVWDLKMLAKKEQSQETNVLLFMGICLDDLRIKEKMLYASTKDPLKKKLDVTGLRDINVSCMADLDYDDLIKNVEQMRK